MIGLLVAMLLMVIVLATANSLFSFCVRACYLNLSRLEVQENLRVGINRVSREVRQAAEITSIDNSGSGRLIFIDPHDNVISYRISKSGDNEAAYQLIRSINGYGHNPVARYVTGLAVEIVNIGTDTCTVQLKLTGEKDDSGKMDVSTSVMLKNYKNQVHGL
ncbi:PilW family protein [Sporotomaculum syntrophicum]|uniref:PilW family protein n=1 Tax=Sporotomaculum syntrophicum TaxID=182264 RepID=UPI001A9C01CD|nr:hypothetical protein [Sporotomaculum syntrophicum]